MTGPTAVTILGQHFTVDWISETEVTTRPRITSDVKAGRSSVAYQWIAVDTEQGPDQLRDTLLHEVIHCCLGVLRLEPDEGLVEALTPVLLDALRANPELVAWLTA